MPVELGMAKAIVSDVDDVEEEGPMTSKEFRPAWMLDAPPVDNLSWEGQVPHVKLAAGYCKAVNSKVVERGNKYQAKHTRPCIEYVPWQEHVRCD